MNLLLPRLSNLNLQAGVYCSEHVEYKSCPYANKLSPFSHVFLELRHYFPDVRRHSLDVRQAFQIFSTFSSLEPSPSSDGTRGGEETEGDESDPGP